MSVRHASALRRNVAAAVGSFLAGGVLLHVGVYSDTGIDLSWWQRLIPLALVCSAMALRTVAPMVGLAVGTVGFMLDLYFGISVASVFIHTDNIYSATVRGPRTTPRVLLIAYALVALTVAGLLSWAGDVNAAVAASAILAVVLVSPVVTGMVVNDHRERAALERDRAAKIAELAEVDRRAALAEERNRMARELHDTIANHFSAIAIQSSAVLSRSGMEPDAVREVVSSIRSNSLAGLADMRQTIEVLRTNDTAEDLVQHRIADLGDLVDRMRAAGLTVSLTTIGDIRPAPVAVEFAAYRIVQEALTNALKHGRNARVKIIHSDEHLTLTVTNLLGDQPTGVPGSGTGLDSMRERATILGGTFAAGPEQPDRWRVHTELPTDRLQGGTA
ncbi:MAG TPA: hypothetical protein H9881_12705 [Candidatus Stackebrandtia excrementipullorum]|nr:hypothetical protein [Candidatus Stackebrandtia excrementipullorum]